MTRFRSQVKYVGTNLVCRIPGRGLMDGHIQAVEEVAVAVSNQSACFS